MAYDKVIESAQLDGALSATADKIRAATGSTDKITWNESNGFADAVPVGAEQATPSISVSSAGLITASAVQSAGYVASGTKSATKQLSIQAAKTVTPTTSDQTPVSSGKYTTGAITVKGDANLIPEYIASGVSIFGVAGSLKSGAQVATGTFTIAALDSSKYYDMSTRGAITVSGTGFTPTRVMAYLSSGTIGGTFHQLIIADIGEQNGFFTTNKSTVAPSINVFTASLNADGFTLDMVEGATRPYVVQGTWFYIAIG